ncbi:MAG: 16S rRNA (guanine(527)-N(7))-methyltransferase RsmG [Armatimonadetes bacterium]|nr:16S rRNA (guanine(527)-N(7))-methyltransferase RsmG [Armatimonadota bacterium]
MNRSGLRDGARRLGVELTEEQLDRYQAQEGAIYSANEQMNLTRVPIEDCWSRHFLDSLTICSLIPEGSSLLDLGTGAGLPGVSVAIARPDLKVFALDAHKKTADFLSNEFGPSGALAVLREVICARAEVAAHDPNLRAKFDVVTGRAFAPLEAQVELSVAFAVVGGLLLPMRTSNDEHDIERVNWKGLGCELERVHQVELPELNAVRLIPVVRKARATQASIPRPWAKIRAQSGRKKSLSQG